MRCSFDLRVRAAPDVVVKALQDEAVLLDMRTEQYYGLDAVSARMWELLNESSSIGAAYRVLEREYDVEPEVLQRDLARIVEELLEHGLLVVANG